MPPKKDPLPSIIQTGYHLTRAAQYAEKALEHALQAHECSFQVRSDLVTEDGPYNAQFGLVMEKIAQAIPAMHAPRAAHDVARTWSLAMGFREVTKEDFEEYGGGGSR